MPIDITMPRLSDTMEKGTIIKWHVAEGDDVAAGDVIADVETDKATMEMQVFDDGRISKIAIGEGLAVEIGTVVAVLIEEDELAEAPPPPDVEPTLEAPPVVVAKDMPAEPTSHRKVTPVARRLAETHGVDLASLEGSGPGGRIVKRDVLAATASGDEMRAAVPPSTRPPAPRVVEPATQIVEHADLAVPATPVSPMPAPLAVVNSDRREVVSGMRQTIARRLVESKQEIPHYQVSMVFPMDAMIDLRARLNSELVDQGVKLSINDLLVRACALAMQRNPLMNASWDGDAIIYHGEVNIGIAVALPEEQGGGLVVPVIRGADMKSLRSISAETRALSEKARTRGLSVDDMSDATFTISNLGMFGVDAFTAIINPPNSAILAVGAALQKPVVRDGELTVGWEMNGTLSNDHRVVDGATAARYLGTLRGLIEHPAGILV